jgi:hypothetical protein
MISFAKFLYRSFKRARHVRSARTRLTALRPNLERVCGGPVRFSPSEGGGHDFVFYVAQKGKRIAVLRMGNDRYVPDEMPFEARLNGPRLRLTARERIAREHRICAAGSASGLTPEPLWISDAHDAAMNRYVDGARLLSCVSQGRIALWDAIGRAAARTIEFHATVGEAHMDLSLMNVLADADNGRLTLIDFELAPNPALSLEEARLFDFLNLVEMAYKFMSPADRQAAPQRLDHLFGQIVPPDLRQAPVSGLAAKLPRILADPLFRTALSRNLTLSPPPTLNPTTEQP